MQVNDDRPERGGAELAALLPTIPADRLMIETDAPYLVSIDVTPCNALPECRALGLRLGGRPEPLHLCVAWQDSRWECMHARHTRERGAAGAILHPTLCRRCGTCGSSRMADYDMYASADAHGLSVCCYITSYMLLCCVVQGVRAHCGCVCPCCCRRSHARYSPAKHGQAGMSQRCCRMC